MGTSTSRYSSRSSQKWAAWGPSSSNHLISYTHTHQTRIFSIKNPSVSPKRQPHQRSLNNKQYTILMLLNIHFFFKCQNFTSDTTLRMMLFVKTENTGKWKSVFTRKKKTC